MNNSAQSSQRWVVPFQELRMTDVDSVGGKNASLGEMISQLDSAGVRVPGGFATTAAAFRAFLDHGGLRERINQALDKLNVDDVRELARCGEEIRRWVVETPLPEALETQIRVAYQKLIDESPASPWPFARLRPPRIFLMRPSRANRRPS